MRWILAVAFATSCAPRVAIDAGPTEDRHDDAGAIDAGQADDAGRTDAGHADDAGAVPLDGGAAPDAGPCSTVALLADDFDDVALAPKWSPSFGGGFGATSLSGDVLRVTRDAGWYYTPGAEQRVTSVPALRFVDGRIDVDVVALPPHDAGTAARFQLRAGDASAELRAFDGALTLRRGDDVLGETIATAPATWRVVAADGGWTFGVVRDGGFAAVGATAALADDVHVRMALTSIVDAGPTGSFVVDRVAPTGAAVACPIDDVDDEFAAAPLSAAWRTTFYSRCGTSFADGALVVTCEPRQQWGVVETRTAYDLRRHAIDVEVAPAAGARTFIALSSTTTEPRPHVEMEDGSVSACVASLDTRTCMGSRRAAEGVVRVRLVVDADGAVHVYVLEEGGAYRLHTYAASSVGVDAAQVALGIESYLTGDDAPVTTRFERFATTYLGPD